MLARRALVAILLLVTFGSLGGCGDDGPPAPRVEGKTQAAWAKQLSSTLPKEQAAALAALAQFDPPPLERIAKFLDKRGRTVRLAAIRAVGTIGPAASGLAPKLAPLLENDPEDDPPEKAGRNSRDFRNAAMLALQKMGKGAFKPIAHMLVAEDPRHRLRAVFTLSAFAADLENGTNTILPLLEDDDANVRREAARALGKAGKRDPRASGGLMKALSDGDARVIAAAAVALGGIGGRSDHEGKALADLLFAHQTGVRSSAVYGLGLMGEEASPYLERIEDLMEHDGKHAVRIQAARAHFRIQGDAEQALPTLVKAVQSEDPTTCREAARALGEIGPEARSCVPQLDKALEHFGANDGLRKILEGAIEAVRGD